MWAASHSCTDANPQVVVICTSLQHLFEWHPWLQINLFIFRNNTKSFSLKKKLSVPLDELRLLHNSLILSALTFSWLLGLFHCSHILGHCLLSCKHNLQFPPHCTLFYLDSSYFITVVLPWSWCDWLSRYQQVSQWWLSSLPLGQS